jgi:hypothetical protein
MNNQEWKKANDAAKNEPDGQVLEMWSGRLAAQGKFLGYLRNYGTLSEGYRKAKERGAGSTAHGYISAGNAYTT